MGKTRKADYTAANAAMDKNVIASFQYPWGTGSYDPTSMAYSYNMSPDEQQTYTQATSIRNDLLKSLGLASTGEDAYTKALMSESLRLSKPQLENSLIGRGLGGSTVYKDALTDLISKAGTQAVLGGRSARLEDLNYLQNLLTNVYNLGGNTLGQVASTGLSQQQLQMAKAKTLMEQENQRVQNAQLAQQQQWQNITNGVLAAAALAAAIPTGGASLLGLSSLGSSGNGLSGLSAAYQPSQFSSPLLAQKYPSLMGAF